MEMNKKERFESPVVTLNEFGPMSPILAGSMDFGARTEGQDIRELDYSDSSWD